MASAPSAGQTEALNGIRIYFETHGTGEPLLLLHGSRVPARTGSSQPQHGPKLPDHLARSARTWPVQHFAEAVPASRRRDRHIGAARPPGNWRLQGSRRRCRRRRPPALGHQATGTYQSHGLGQCDTLLSTAGASHHESLCGKPPRRATRILCRHHFGGEPQVRTLLESTKSFATSYDDMNFTPPYLSVIQARTLIVQGDRDPRYPVELR